MSLILPIVFIAAMLLSIWLSYSKGKLGISSERWIGAFAIVVIAVLLSRHFGSPSQASTISVGALIGAVTIGLAAVLESFGAQGAALLALAGAAGAVTSLVAQKDLSNAVLSETAIATLAALAIGARATMIVSIAMAALSFSQILGTYANSSFTYQSSGEMFMLALALLGVAGQIVQRFGKLDAKVWIPVSVVLALGIVYGCSAKQLAGDIVWKPLLLAVLAAAIAHFSFSNEETGSFSAVLLSVIWIGLATVAFGVSKGFGITLVLVVSLSLLILWNSDKPILSAGPLLALALHRVFRELHPGISAAIDIDEHYALIGFSVGVLIPLLPGEWLERAKGVAASRTASGLLLWEILGLATPALLALFLAPKGLLGFVTGLGFCGLLALFKGRGSLTALIVAAGLGAVSVIEYGWVEGLSQMTRSDKIHWFEYCSAGLALAAVLLYFLGRGTLLARKVQVS